HGGITVGEDGATHQALEDVALMRVIPTMTVIVPADAYETSQCISSAVDYYGPMYIRLGRSKVPSVLPAEYKFQIGKAFIFNIGKDVNIIANGIMVAEALKASEILNKEGISTGVANFSSVKPLDEEALFDIAKNSKLIVTAEEHSIIGGLGSAVTEFVAENHPVKVKRIGVKDTFGCSGPWKELIKLYGLTAENIVNTVKESLKK
ncbi:MAG: transketolase family protein, partial [Thermodesulfovibrio sp.]|nr:transketolase family protein [Thermodesulfovibrio sp.]